MFRAEQYIASAEMRFEDADYFDLVKELKSSVEDLIEFVNDKSIAGCHQKRVNKMLAERIQDLERELAKSITISKMDNMTANTAAIARNDSTMLFNKDFEESNVP